MGLDIIWLDLGINDLWNHLLYFQPRKACNSRHRTLRCYGLVSNFIRFILVCASRKVCKPGAPVCMFIDWRQLPAATDALQWAGWIWRGTAVWDKGNSRPQKGRFRQQAEYIVWGSNGDMPISRPVPCLPGVFKYGNPQNRIHLTEKPLQLMRDVVKITEPGGRILDPFAGSGSTVLAAVLEGYSATGIEVTDAYAALSKERIVRELAQSA